MAPKSKASNLRALKFNVKNTSNLHIYIIPEFISDGLTSLLSEREVAIATSKEEKDWVDIRKSSGVMINV